MDILRLRIANCYYVANPSNLMLRFLSRLNYYYLLCFVLPFSVSDILSFHFPTLQTTTANTNTNRGCNCIIEIKILMLMLRASVLAFRICLSALLY
jgi:hypothetical protein